MYFPHTHSLVTTQAEFVLRDTRKLGERNRRVNEQFERLFATSPERPNG
jgi:hypothetical protein